jgi:hypothetical protein
VTPEGTDHDAALAHDEVLVIPNVDGMTRGEAAVAYAKAGWLVGPLWWMRGSACACGKPHDAKRNGKHPLGIPGFALRGKDDFANRIPQVAGWWRRYPTANIGILPPADYFALDIDDPDLWEANGVELPEEGPAQFTGSGNGHRQHLYRLDRQGRDGIVFNTKLDGCGAETKGDGGGYIVVPPSVTAGAYSWLRTGPVPPVPVSLHAILPRKADRWAAPAASAGDCCAVPATIERDPGGYEWLLRRSAHLKATHGLHAAERRSVLVTYLPLMQPPYPANEGVDTLARIIEYDEQNPDRIATGGNSTVATTSVETTTVEFTRLPPEGMEPPPPRLLSPLICDSRTAWFGAQGAGKGVLVVIAVAALANADSAFIPGSLVEKPVRVGILDWEDNEDEWAERLHRAGVTARSVPYLAPTGPLTNTKVIAEVRRWIDGEGVELVAVDSVIPAAGGTDAMKPEAPTAYYQSLRLLERPSLSIAHVPKDKAQARHPFGSTYWSTPSRLVWRIERLGDGDAEHVIRLVNTKHSRWPWSTEMLLKVDWAEPGPLRLRSALNLTLEKDKAPLIDRIVLALRVVGQSLSAEEIAERVGSSADTVRRTIERNRGRVVDDGGRPALFNPVRDAR